MVFILSNNVFFYYIKEYILTLISCLYTGPLYPFYCPFLWLFYYQNIAVSHKRIPPTRLPFLHVLLPPPSFSAPILLLPPVCYRRHALCLRSHVLLLSLSPPFARARCRCLFLSGRRLTALALCCCSSAFRPVCVFLYALRFSTSIRKTTKKKWSLVGRGRG